MNQAPTYAIINLGYCECYWPLIWYCTSVTKTVSALPTIPVVMVTLINDIMAGGRLCVCQFFSDDMTIHHSTSLLVSLPSNIIWSELYNLSVPWKRQISPWTLLHRFCVARQHQVIPIIESSYDFCQNHLIFPCDLFFIWPPMLGMKVKWRCSSMG